jgi:hypothetical protein
MQTRYDVWQAASLLIGLYGHQALGYAITRRDMLRAEGDVAGSETWNLIGFKIEEMENLHGKVPN